MELLIIFGIVCLAVFISFGVGYIRAIDAIESKVMGTLKFKYDEDGTYMFLETPNDPVTFLEKDQVVFKIDRPQK